MSRLSFILRHLITGVGIERASEIVDEAYLASIRAKEDAQAAMHAECLALIEVFRETRKI